MCSIVLVIKTGRVSSLAYITCVAMTSFFGIVTWFQTSVRCKKIVFNIHLSIFKRLSPEAWALWQLILVIFAPHAGRIWFNIEWSCFTIGGSCCENLSCGFVSFNFLYNSFVMVWIESRACREVISASIVTKLTKCSKEGKSLPSMRVTVTWWF